MNEFDDVIRRLRENRPEATALELDEIKQRVRRRAARPERRQDMKSRLAILLMLVLGMMLSTTGAGLAIQGLSGGNAAQQQYDEEEQQPPGGVLGEDDSGSGGTGDNGATTDNSTDVQPAAQVETGSDTGELPFTGFLALPILIGGVALMSAGFVLRRRTRDG
ncbi:MAG TPA: hypothetical protein VHJ39_06950 [Solirubrobacteraceae bacterium]|jgi:hypothetical protein|nr:hypothetical protein [Solirubrobacteraceae bacterium]